MATHARYALLETITVAYEYILCMCLDDVRTNYNTRARLCGFKRLFSFLYFVRVNVYVFRVKNTESLEKVCRLTTLEEN